MGRPLLMLSFAGFPVQQLPPASTLKKLDVRVGAHASVPMKSAEEMHAGGQLPERHAKKDSMSDRFPIALSQLKSAEPHAWWCRSAIQASGFP